MRAFGHLKKIIAAAFGLIMILILADVLILQNFVDQYLKKEFSLPNFCFFLIGAAGISLLCFLGIRCYRRFQKKLDRLICKKTVIVLSTVLFAVQLFIAYHIYFGTGWDAGLVCANAMKIAGGEEIDLFYYSQYPNNIFLTYVYAAIFWIGRLFVPEDGFFAVVVVQCLLSAAVAYLVYSVTFELVHNKTIALAAFFLYAGYIGLSPWFVIPYSDASGIFFPLMIFRLWQMARASDSKYKSYAISALMGAVAFLGYKIKPQIVIVFIAISLICVAKTVLLGLKEKKFSMEFVKLGVGVLAFLICTVSFSAMMRMNKTFVLDEECEIGIPHFLMMGLNEETNGVWSESDVAFSSSFATVEERNAANMQEVKNRIREYGFVGLTQHVIKKTLVNFGDGTFAWGNEGHFYQKVYPERDEIFSPFFRSFYYEEGSRYAWFINVSQLIWIMILSLAVFAVVYAWKSKDEKGVELSVLLLSLLGLIAFETLFESRARYLFTYAPIFIICAAIGLYVILKAVKAKGEKE